MEKILTVYRVTIKSHEDGEIWQEDYTLKIDAERRAEAAEENGNTASYKKLTHVLGKEGR